MKVSEIREMNLEEMQRRASELKEELFNLRFQHEIGQLENPQKMNEARKDIARLKTIMREIEMKSQTDKE